MAKFFKGLSFFGGTETVDEDPQKNEEQKVAFRTALCRNSEYSTNEAVENYFEDFLYNLSATEKKRDGVSISENGILYSIDGSNFTEVMSKFEVFLNILDSSITFCGMLVESNKFHRIKFSGVDIVGLRCHDHEMLQLKLNTAGTFIEYGIHIFVSSSLVRLYRCLQAILYKNLHFYRSFSVSIAKCFDKKIECSNFLSENNNSKSSATNFEVDRKREVLFSEEGNENLKEKDVSNNLPALSSQAILSDSSSINFEDVEICFYNRLVNEVTGILVISNSLLFEYFERKKKVKQKKEKTKDEEDGDVYAFPLILYFHLLEKNAFLDFEKALDKEDIAGIIWLPKDFEDKFDRCFIKAEEKIVNSALKHELFFLSYRYYRLLNEEKSLGSFVENENFFSEEEEDEFFDFSIPDVDEGKELKWYGFDNKDEGNYRNCRRYISINSDMVNKFLEIGHDRAFIFRKNSPPLEDSSKMKAEIQIQKLAFHEEEDEGYLIIQNPKFQYNNYQVSPRGSVLMNQESKMILTDTFSKNEVFSMDLHSEKIVEKWKSDDINFKHLLPAFKGAEKTPHRVLFGYDENALFFLDTRMKNITKGPQLQYKTPLNFSSGATDSFGHILMGSEKDKNLRLYDGRGVGEKLSIAKTMLAGLGDSILHVSVTGSGEWILATTSDYLFLYNTRVKNTKNRETTNAFCKRITKNLKPKHIILKMSELDAKLYGDDDGKLRFKKAEFDWQESMIVAVAGKVCIAWDFDSVKASKTEKYTVYNADGNVQDMSFSKNENFPRVILATSHWVDSRFVN